MDGLRGGDGWVRRRVGVVGGVGVVEVRCVVDEMRQGGVGVDVEIHIGEQRAVEQGKIKRGEINQSAYVLQGRLLELK
jgi:hypothetical protein